MTCAWCQDDDFLPSAQLVHDKPCCGREACIAVLECIECSGTGWEERSRMVTLGGARFRAGHDVPCGFCRPQERGVYEDDLREDAMEARVGTMRDAQLEP